VIPEVFLSGETFYIYMGPIINGFRATGIRKVASLERFCYWKKYFCWEEDRIIVQNVCTQLGIVA
jgi:hypothetical protein